MGSKRSGAQRAGRQAVTRRQQKRARMSLGPAPRTPAQVKAGATIAEIPEVRQAQAPAAILAPASAPAPQSAPAPAKKDAPRVDVAARAGGAPTARPEWRADQSGPDTQPLVVPQTPGRRRYPTLARMASIAPRHPADSSSASALEQAVPPPVAATAAGGADGAPAWPLRFHAIRPERRPRRMRVGHPMPLPRADVVLVVASLHAALAVVATLVGAALLLAGSRLWFWPLLLAGAAGPGGWVAYAASQAGRRHTTAAAALACSQAGLLVWALAVAGPRTSLLLLVPGAVFLALRTSGRTTAALLAVAALAAYATDRVLSLVWGVPPVIPLDPLPSALLDGALAALGVLLAIAGAFDATAGRAQAELVARARLGEVRRLQARIDRLRRQSEDDAAALYRALDSALEGTPAHDAGVDGVLSPVVARIVDVGEYVADLRDELRERYSLEAALGQLALALERAWLGLAWSWPAPTGTPVDDVVSLLRTPNPRHLAPLVAEDQPTAPIPVPTDPEMRARRRVIPSPRSNPNLTSGARHTDPRHDIAHALARPELRPPARHTSPLRWQEWDEWRAWQGDPAD